jgi:Putative peptidoglycan binding domain
MMKLLCLVLVRRLAPVCIGFALLAGASANGQQDTTASGAQPSGVARPPGLEFYRAVPFSEARNLVVFVDSNDVLFLVPSHLEVDQAEVKVLYHPNGNTSDSGLLNFTLRPRLSSEMTDDEAIGLVRAEYPEADISFVLPRLVRAEATLFGRRLIMTPYTTTFQLGEPMHFSVPLNAEGLGFFLSARTTDVPVGSVFLIVSIRGYELGVDGTPAVTDRRIAVSGYLDGGCARHEQSFINAASGRVGCVVPILYPRREIAAAQELLKAAGLYNGEIDGLFGPLSSKAVAEAQRRFRLPVTGTLDFMTYEAISAHSFRAVARRE